MNKSPIFGKIKDGSLKVPRFFQKDLASWEGLEVEIRPVERSRTAQQNKYLWGVVYKLASEETGFTGEEIHEVFKKKFLRYNKEYKGKMYPFTRSTTDLNISEFTGYVEKVRRFCQADLGIIIPDAEIIE